jgi:hypothetical protein
MSRHPIGTRPSGDRSRGLSADPPLLQQPCGGVAKGCQQPRFRCKPLASLLRCASIALLIATTGAAAGETLTLRCDPLDGNEVHVLTVDPERETVIQRIVGNSIPFFWTDGKVETDAQGDCALRHTLFVRISPDQIAFGSRDMMLHACHPLGKLSPPAKAGETTTFAYVIDRTTGIMTGNYSQYQCRKLLGSAF